MTGDSVALLVLATATRQLGLIVVALVELWREERRDRGVVSLVKVAAENAVEVRLRRDGEDLTISKNMRGTRGRP